MKNTLKEPAIRIQEPEPRPHHIHFRGDAIFGELWDINEQININGIPHTKIQFKPNEHAFKRIRQDTHLKNLLDQETGITITQTYPSHLHTIRVKKPDLTLHELNCDITGKPVEDHKPLTEKIERLEKELDNKKNQLLILQERIRNSQSNQLEYLKEFAKMKKVLTEHDHIIPPIRGEI